MKKELVAGLSIFVLCLFLPSIALSDNQKSSIETYLEDLHSQGKERVFVMNTLAYQSN